MNAAALRRGGFLGLFLARLDRTRILALGLGIAIDQLDHRHRRGIAMAEACLVDAAIAAGALAVALGERGHHLVGDLLVLQRRDQAAARGEAAMLAHGDEALNHRAKILRLGQRRGDLLMLQQCMAEIVEHRFAMGLGAAEATTAETVTHVRYSIRLKLNTVPRGASPAPRYSQAASSGSPCRDRDPSGPALP